METTGKGEERGKKRLEEMLEDACVMRKKVEKDEMLQKVYGKSYFPRLVCELEERLEDLKAAETLFSTK